MSFGRTTHRSAALVASTWALLLFTGCTGGDAEAGSGVSVTFDTINRVAHVRNAGAPAVWQLRELFTLGTVAGMEASPEEFGRITSVIADANGNVYVADASAFEIRVFDGHGKLLRRIGRKGSGPGEFVNLQSIGWLGDTLVVMDAMNARLGLLSRSGEWLGQRPHARITGGDIRLHQTSLHELYAPAPRRTEFGFARHTPAAVTDTLPIHYDPNRIPSTVRCTYNSGGGISYHIVSFSPRLIRVPGPAGTRVDIWSADYRIAFLSPNGDTLRVIERDVPPKPVSAAEWAEEEASYRAFLKTLPPVTCQPSSLPRPENKDLIRGIFFDDAGRMWVNLRKESGFAFDVFDAEGRLLGTVDVPDRVERIPPHIRGNRLYLVTADSLDVQFVKAFEIGGQR